MERRDLRPEQRVNWSLGPAKPGPASAPFDRSRHTCRIVVHVSGQTTIVARPVDQSVEGLIALCAQVFSRT